MAKPARTKKQDKRSRHANYAKKSKVKQGEDSTIELLTDIVMEGACSYQKNIEYQLSVIERVLQNERA